MRIDMNVKGDKELERQLQRIGDASADILETAARSGAQIVLNAARNNVKGQGLIITRTLSRSLHMETAEKSRFRAVINVGTNLVYAAIHEYGGIIRPKVKQFLRFVIDGRVIFAKAVQIPARPYLRPGYKENKQNVINEIREVMRIAILKAVKK